VKILHDFDISSVDASIPKENFEVDFIDELSSNIEKYKSDEALQRLLKLDLNYQSAVLDRFGKLQTICQEKDFDTRLTHGDAPGNVLYTNEDLFIIDWDDLMLAPIERDLWFHKGAESFFKEYGETQLDNDYYAFYLFRRYLDDLSGFLDEIFKNRNNETTVGENIKGIEKDVNGWLKPSVDEFINQSK